MIRSVVQNVVEYIQFEMGYQIFFLMKNGMIYMFQMEAITMLQKNRFN